MSRSVGDPGTWPPWRDGAGARSTASLALLVLLSALLFAGVPAAAQPAADASADLLSSQQVLYSLDRLQEGWLQWTTALHSDDEERAHEVVDDLVQAVHGLGMRGVPDLAAGALVQAVEAAREGEGAHAGLALEAAERLAPARPETAFAAAEVARLSGDWPRAVLAEVRGYARLARAGLERRLALYDIALWALASLLLAGALFVVMEMAVHGPALARDLGRAASGRFQALPGPAVALAVVLLLLWPLALPSGLLWLVLYWSFLLWGYLAGAERAVLVFVWLAVAGAPTAVTEIDQRVTASLSPAERAMEGIARGDLYGGLFTDLGVLPAALPDDPAVDHFLADVHIRLGQWDDARRLYERVLAAEEDNVAALVNLGVYYFHRDDLGNAVDLLRRAAAVDTGDRADRAAALFDLSQAYADSNLFDEHTQAFNEARRIDDALVNAWGLGTEESNVITVEGGIERIGEIERALHERHRTQAAASPALAVLRRARSALLALLLAAAAIAAHAVVRRRHGPPEIAAGPDRSAAGGRWLGDFVPGVSSLREGRGVRALVEIGLLVAPALALLGGVGGLGYELPWRHDPGRWFQGALALLVLVGVLVSRVVKGWSGRRDRPLSPAVRGGG